MELDLAGKIALVTGANNPMGIGAAVALALAREGARVAVSYWPLHEPYDPAGLDRCGDDLYRRLRSLDGAEVAARLRAAGADFCLLEADLTLPGAADALLDRAEQALGPVDILVNNAAYAADEDALLTLSGPALNETFALNVRAALLLTQAFVRRFQARGGTGGRVVNLSTDAAQTFAGQIGYGASKAAVEAFTRAAAIEAAPYGVTVNAVAPGPVQTGYIDAETASRVLSDIPLGRLGRPEDIADAIVFLASERAGWLTGQVLKVSGGHEI